MSINRTIFIGPLAENVFTRASDVSLAAVSWYKNVYEAYIVNRSERICESWSIRQERSWPFGSLFPYFTKPELHLKSLTVRYLNIKFLKEFTIFFVLLIRMFSIKKIDQDHKTLLYFYNLEWYYVALLKIMKVMRRRDRFKANLLLLDYDLDDQSKKKFELYLNEFDSVFSCSNWLVKELIFAHPSVTFFAGGISKKIHSKTLYPNNKVIYSGKYDIYGGVSAVIEAIRLSREFEFEWHFTGYGISSELKKLSKIRSDIHIHGVLDAGALDKLIAKCYNKLIPGDFNFNSYKTVFPSKVWMYLASGGRLISVDYPGYPLKLRERLLIVSNDEQDFLKCIRNWRMDKIVNTSEQFMLTNQINILE